MNKGDGIVQKQSKWLKASMAVMLGVTILAPTSAMATEKVTEKVEQAKEAVFSVNMKVTNASGTTVAEGPIDVAEGATALDAFKQFVEKNDVTYSVVESDYGPFLDMVADDQTGKFNGWDGWSYSINDAEPQVGIGSYEVQADDQLHVYYSRWAAVTAADIVDMGAVNPSITLDLVGDEFAEVLAQDQFTITGQDITVKAVERVSNQQVKLQLAGEVTKLGALTVAMDNDVFIGTPRDPVTTTINVVNTPKFAIKDGVATATVNSSEAVLHTNIEKKILEDLIDKVDTIVIKSDLSTVTIPTALFTEDSLKQDFSAVMVNVTHQDEKVTYAINLVGADGNAIALPITSAYSSFTFMSKDGAVAYTDDKLNATPYHVKGNTVTVFTKENKTVMPIAKSVELKDIAKLPNRERIQFLANRHIIKGSQGNFMPANKVTRGQYAAMVARSLGLVPTKETTLKDIEGLAFEDAIQALYEAGITTGDTNGNYRPGGTISREHAAVFTARILRYAGVEETTEKLGFTDVKAINADYVDDIAFVKSQGIMNGYLNGNFGPKDQLTRSQLAEILYKTLETIDFK